MFKQGDIVFVMHHGNKISRVIAWFMQSNFSHSAIVCSESFFGNILLTETSDFEVMNNTLDRYIKDENVSIEIYRDDSISDQERHFIALESFKQVGNLYGYLQLISFAIRNIIKRITKKTIRHFIRQGQVCCSVIGYSYQNALGNAHWLGRIDPESYETEELRQLCIKNNLRKIYEKEAKNK